MPRMLIALHAAALAPLVLAVTPGEARIVCKDGYQKSGGTWISTPYCNDAHVADIARRHGVRVSDSEVRNNPSKKYEVCRFLEGASEIRNYCPDTGSSRD